MSCEQLSMSREKKRAFRAGKFPEDIITKDMIQELRYTIECSPGAPNPREFRMTEGMLLINVPAWMSPPIEYCDHLLSVNSVAITSKRQLHGIIRTLYHSKKHNFVEFVVRRVISVERIIDQKLIPINATCYRPATTDPLQKPPQGYEYYKVVLIFFPKSKLGINIKSYQNVVYVESTDNTWGSTTRRFLYVGDAVLKVDDFLITDIKAMQTNLRAGLNKNGLVTLIVERATDQSSYNFVRGVLSFQKAADPQLAQDVILTCRQHLEYLEKNGFGPEPESIFRGDTNFDYSKQGRVKMTNKVEVRDIAGENINPKILQKVPDYQTINPTNNQ